MSIDRPDQSRMHTRSEAALQRVKAYLAIPLLIIALVFLVTAVKAFTTPSAIEQVADTVELRQEVAFDYSATTRPSTLYPTVTKLARQSRYLLNLTDTFTVTILANISSGETQEITGTYLVIMKLTADDLWEKEYLLMPETAFQGEGRVTLELPIDIPFRDLLSFAESVAKEAWISSGSYTLVISPQIAAQTRVGDELLESTFTPWLTFELSSSQLVPKGMLTDRYSSQHDPEQDLVQVNLTSRQQTELVPNSLVILGFPFQPRGAGLVFGLLAAAIIAYAFPLARGALTKRAPLAEHERIANRYGKRLIEVNSASINLGVRSIPLKRFQALLTIADEREKPVFYAVDSSDEQPTHIYYLMDEGITYYYIIQQDRGSRC
jgi:hypothetical protein